MDIVDILQNLVKVFPVSIQQMAQSLTVYFAINFVYFYILLWRNKLSFSEFIPGKTDLQRKQRIVRILHYSRMLF